MEPPYRQTDPRLLKDRFSRRFEGSTNRIPFPLKHFFCARDNSTSFDMRVKHMIPLEQSNRTKQPSCENKAEIIIVFVFVFWHLISRFQVLLFVRVEKLGERINHWVSYSMDWVDYCTYFFGGFETEWTVLWPRLDIGFRILARSQLNKLLLKLFYNRAQF